MNRGKLTTGLVLVVSAAGLAGCASRPRGPREASVAAAAASAAPPASAGEVPPSYPTPPPLRAEGIPVSIRRIVAERRDELRDMGTLAAVVGDARGRQRAQAEVETLAHEFSAIEHGLDSAESATLDATMVRLQALETRIGLLHDALRQANLQAGSAKAVD
ncbi:MAG: hypothetical protein JST00_01850 [Deltaproteobacteria bacterium]|nr:hypothetical protein [Deltaproteobacteria bacterium]